MLVGLGKGALNVSFLVIHYYPLQKYLCTTTIISRIARNILLAFIPTTNIEFHGEYVAIAFMKTCMEYQERER